MERTHFFSFAGSKQRANTLFRPKRRYWVEPQPIVYSRVIQPIFRMVRLVLKTAWAAAVAIGVIAWSVLCALVVGKVAYAAPNPMEVAAPVSSPQVYYAAKFKWKSQDMTLQLVRNKKNDLKVLIRTSENGKSEPEALCTIQEPTPVKYTPARTIALDMSCQSARFGVLATPATLMITRPASGRVQSPSLIRFGSWLQGYKKAPLMVITNHTSDLFKAVAAQKRLAMK